MQKSNKRFIKDNIASVKQKNMNDVVLNKLSFMKGEEGSKEKKTHVGQLVSPTLNYTRTIPSAIVSTL